MQEPGAEFEVRRFCKEVRVLLQKAARCIDNFGLKAEGYCFDFAYRKFIIAEAARSKGAVNWETGIHEIRRTSADSGEHLRAIDDDTVSVAFSYAVFGRADWAIMLSCFTCLWSEVEKKFVNGGVLAMSDLLEVLPL